MEEIKSRKDFYANELDLNRANDSLTQLISKCTLKEIFWIFKNIMYDQVAYWSQESHSKIYDTDSEELIEQSNRLQQQLSSIVDLYEQSIIDKRLFDQNYLKDYEFARIYLRIINDKQAKIEALEEQINSCN